MAFSFDRFSIENNKVSPSLIPCQKLAKHFSVEREELLWKINSQTYIILEDFRRLSFIVLLSQLRYAKFWNREDLWFYRIACNIVFVKTLFRFQTHFRPFTTIYMLQ